MQQSATCKSSGAIPCTSLGTSLCTNPKSPKQTTLPNVFPELIQGTFDGSTLIVKNTFIDLMQPSAEGTGFRMSRARSSPDLFSESNEEDSRRPRSATFLETRQRLLTFDCGDGAGVDDAQEKHSCSGTASTCTPASSASQFMPTTVLLKNIPEEYTREMLINTLNTNGFASKIDFAYFPMDFGTRRIFGYAYINCVTPDDADDFFDAFEGFDDWVVPSSKVADVDWSDRQGLDSMIERYRNSPLMHTKVPDDAKPILLQNGERAEFPPPSQKLKPLRVRQSKVRKARALGHAEVVDVHD